MKQLTLKDRLAGALFMANVLLLLWVVSYLKSLVAWDLFPGVDTPFDNWFSALILN